MSRLSGEREFLMKTELANDPFSERYVVEIDGIAKAEYCVFVEALTAGLQLKQEFPNSNIKLRDADEKAPLRAHLRHALPIKALQIDRHFFR
jgi:hypothetical protein